MKTIWKCETCGATGEVWHSENAGVIEVIDMVTDHHRTARKNPTCIEWRKIRIVSVEAMESKM